MYGYLTSFVILFLVHVLLFTNLGVQPGIWGGILQAGTVLILNLPSDGKPAFSYTMAIIYYVSLGIWAYVKVRLALAGRG